MVSVGHSGYRFGDALYEDGDSLHSDDSGGRHDDSDEFADDEGMSNADSSSQVHVYALLYPAEVSHHCSIDLFVKLFMI